MHDQGQITFPGGLDMDHEAATLPGEIAAVVKIIETGFADRNDLVARRQLAQDRHFRLRNIDVIGMYAGGAQYLWISGHAIMHRVETFEVDTNAQHAGYAVIFDPGEQGLEIVVEIGQVDAVEVAMRVEKQRAVFRAVG